MSGKQDFTQETNRRSPPLCSTGCGFYSNPRNNGMCSMCYKDFLQRQSSSGCAANSAASPSSHSSSSSSRGETLLAQSCDSTTVTPPAATSSEPEDPGQCSGPSTSAKSSLTANYFKPPVVEGSVDGTAETQKKSKVEKNRCFTCRKKVGLTGFDCRCGHIFCSLHRYSDEHNCTFDYKAEGAERLRRENPKVTGEKIQKL